MTTKVSLHSLFESNRGELKQKVKDFSLPKDAFAVQEAIAKYMNTMLDSDGEFRQNLTQSEDYVLQAALSLLNAQQEIANTIYNKMTPGIATFDIGSSISSGDPKREHVEFTSSLKQEINWKKCKPSKPKMVLKYIINNSYSKDVEENNIKNVIKNYTKELKMNDTFTIGGLISEINRNCIPTNSSKNNQYIYLSGSFDGDKQVVENNNSYFDYDNATFTFSIEQYTGENYSSIGELTIE